jgi:hypothetical protein
MGGLRNRFQVSARRLPESLRAPVLALPPREPVLALPPREGRALSRLVGVLGAISLRLRSDCVDGGDDSGRTAGVCGRVRVLSRRVERTKSRDSCKARLYGVIAVQQAVLQTTAAVKNIGATAKGGCKSACGSTALSVVLTGIAALSMRGWGMRLVGANHVSMRLD